MLCGEMRSMRDRPEPFSITKSGRSKPRAFAQSRMLRAPRAARPGRLLSSASMVSSSCRAITLLLNLLMSVTIVASGAEVWVYSTRAFFGVGPSFITPLQVPPASRHKRAKVPANNPPSSNKLTYQLCSPQSRG